MNLKILYIVIDEYDAGKMTGVSRKIFSKVSSFREEGCDAELLLIKTDAGSNATSFVYQDGFISQYAIGMKDLLPVRLNKIKMDLHLYRQIGSIIEKKTFDVILFRYPGASIGLLNLVKRFPGKIYFEHNTLEVDELIVNIRQKKNHISFSLSPSGFLYWFQEKKLPILSEKFIAPSVFKFAAGGVCITDEIADHERKKYRRYKTIVTGNGYDFKKGAPQLRYFKNGEKLIIGFVVSSKLIWFGLERILRSLKEYNRDNIEIWIAGINEEDAIKHPAIRYMGYLSDTELETFYEKIHVALGAMAAYKKNLYHASALKIKESIAQGLPFVIGYKEQGISDNPGYKEYFMEVSNDDALIDFGKIYAFAVNFYNGPGKALGLYEQGKNDFSTSVISKKIIQHLDKQNLQH